MVLLPLLTLLVASPQFESFQALGYQTPVCGVWYTLEDQVSPFPLGGLGTGFIEINNNGTFGASTCENDWLKPKPVPASNGFTIRFDDKILSFRGDRAQPVPLRAWGHFPSIDFEPQTDRASLLISCRAFAPLAPNEYEFSGMPCGLFHFVVKNQSAHSQPCEIALQWKGKGEAIAAPLGAAISMIREASGTYAIGAIGRGWKYASEEADGSSLLKASLELEAGATVDLVFGIAWHFPNWISSDGERLTHHYANLASNAGEVLQKALPNALEVEKKICHWQSRIYRTETPSQLKDAVINSLYILPRNAWWLSDGRFFQSESFTGCPITETFVCRFYGSLPLAMFWKDLEIATMRQIRGAQRPSGEIPFAFGSPAGSRSPYYHCQHPIVSTEYVLVTWRNKALWNDLAYLQEMYPSVKLALQFGMTLDKDSDGLIDEDPGSEIGFPANQYYDNWPWWGVSSYTASLWLAALAAGEKMALEMRDNAFAEELKGWAARGAKSFQDKLWNGSHYRLYNDFAKGRVSDTLLANALCGQWFAMTNQLPDLVPNESLLSHIDQVFKLNAAATPFGTVNGMQPDGSIVDTFRDHSTVVTIGETWSFCAMAYLKGKRQEAMDLFTRSYDNIALLQKTPWNIPWCLDRETGAIKWGIHYYSNPCVWTLFQAAAQRPEAK